MAINAQQKFRIWCLLAVVIAAVVKDSLAVSNEAEYIINTVNGDPAATWKVRGYVRRYSSISQTLSQKTKKRSIIFLSKSLLRYKFSNFFFSNIVFSTSRLSCNLFHSSYTVIAYKLSRK